MSNTLDLEAGIHYIDEKTNRVYKSITKSSLDNECKNSHRKMMRQVSKRVLIFGLVLLSITLLGVIFLNQSHTTPDNNEKILHDNVLENDFFQEMECAICRFSCYVNAFLNNITESLYVRHPIAKPPNVPIKIDHLNTEHTNHKDNDINEKNVQFNEVTFDY